MLHILHKMKKINFFFLLFVIMIIFAKAELNSLKINNVTWEYDDKYPSINLSYEKSQNEKKTIKIKLIEIRERFANNQTFTKSQIPPMNLTDLNLTYSDQSVDCDKINIQSNNILNITTNDSLINIKKPNLEIQYFFFNDTGWIDDQTNYVRHGNLMIQLNIYNYSFCEDIVNEFNRFISEKNTTAINAFNIKNYPNCMDYYQKDPISGKYILLENKYFNQSMLNNWKNISYFEVIFEIISNDETIFIYDKVGEVLVQKANYSYLRLYQSIQLDEKDDNMEDGYPKISTLGNSKYITLQFPKFKNKGTAWIFVDMNFIPAPTNFKNFANIAFFVILICTVIAIVFVLYRRKKLKEQLLMEEKAQNLSNF